MRNKIIGIALILALTASVGFAQAKIGPIVDKVLIDVRMDEGIGLKDAAEGKTDFFLWGVQGPTYMNLPAADKAKLDVYGVPSGSWSLLLNPYPNAAPYQVALKDGTTTFNPLAIKDVRFAINFLIDRKKLVDEVLQGTGIPMFSMATPGQPGTYKYNLLSSKFGFTPTGNEKKAIADIDAAMQKAAALPENKGRLAKSGGFWKFDGKDVVIKIFIRVDDPQGRLKEGRYVADQLEKAGFKVDRQERDRKVCINTAYYTNPADFEWSMYTEGWGAGATRAWWDNIVAQMYAPWYTNMPGGGEADLWNYQQPEIDALAKAIVNGNYLTEEEYWDKILKATELGMADSVRIYVLGQMQYYVANKARFNGRVAYGLGDGPNNWSFVTADVKPDASGQKVLKVSQYSAKGGLFMSAWDPVGTNGFNDVYSLFIAQPCVDEKTFEAPNSARDTPWRASWSKVDTQIGKEGDKLVGKIAVPANAILYNSNTKKWETGIEYVQDGDNYVYKKVSNQKAFSTSTATYKHSKWHNGRMGGIEDVLYATAFAYDWSNIDGPGDKTYEASYASSAQAGQEPLKGVVVNADGTITTYMNFNFPMDKNRVGATLALGTRIIPQGVPAEVCWEVNEALAALVSQGSKSGTVYTFGASNEGATEVDVLNPTCVADIKDKLQSFVAANYVPPYISNWVTPAKAVEAYKLTIAFIDKYGHAFIGNGPFFLSKFDATAGSAYAELSAFRDPTYPFKSDYWPKVLSSSYARIDSLQVGSVASGKDVLVNVRVSSVTYPAEKASPVASAYVKFTLVAGKETQYRAYAVKDKPGLYQGRIPAKDVAGLKAGSYTIVAEAALEREAPAVETAFLNVGGF
jgi:peptide/nickel transport system substrate-binding protein